MIILVISCVLCILMEKGGGGQRRLNDKWNRVWIELLEEGRGKGRGAGVRATTIGRRSGDSATRMEI